MGPLCELFALASFNYFHFEHLLLFFNYPACCPAVKLILEAFQKYSFTSENVEGLTNPP